MSHFPAGQPKNKSVTKFSRDSAQKTQETFIVTYTSGTVNFGASVGTLATLFTTDASRGRFFPLWIVASKTYSPYTQVIVAGSPTSPQFTIGWDAATLYTEFGEGYDSALAVSSSETGNAGRYGTWHFSLPGQVIYSNESSTALSAPPSTPIILRMTASSQVDVDYRRVTIAGVYTG